jgi:poly(3-hydroxybutyrate) depolymerase
MENISMSTLPCKRIINFFALSILLCGVFSTKSFSQHTPNAANKYFEDIGDPSDASNNPDNNGRTALDKFLAGTTPLGSIDLDGNGQYDALTDGLLLLRGMFELDGSALVKGAIASNAVYTNPEDIASRIESLGELADIDGNGQRDALTDGLLALRYLFGLQGDTLVNGVVAQDAVRTTTQQIETHLQTLMPTPDEGGCPQTNWSSGIMAIDHDGVERQIRVHVPANYKNNITSPLVIGFHGWGGDQDEFLNNEVVRNELDKHNYIMISPLGLGSEEPGAFYSSWSFRGSTTGLDGDGINTLVVNDSDKICDTNLTPNYTYPSCQGVAANSCSWTHCLDDDVSFVKSLVAQAQQNLCIDSDRIFATGGSNGGMFVWELGQNELTADIFRAVAPIIGLPHRGYLSEPKKVNGLPVILITGMRDTAVPPGDWNDKSFTTTTNGEAYFYTGASAIVEKWAETLLCDTSIPPEIVDLGVTTSLECRSWNSCAGEGAIPPVLDCRGSTMGHTYDLDETWPLVMQFFGSQ